MLETSGASVVVAQSLDDAVAKYRQHPPHVLVVDIRPGYWNEFSLIQEIRDYNVEYRGFTPAIAIMSCSSPDDEKRAIDAGFNAHLTWPFTQRDIVSAVIKVWRDSHDVAA
jgi:CheY-like chemotaxis protein